MEKPKKQTREYWDYHECRDYLEEKFSFEERDVLGKFKGNPNADYRDFWHFVVDRAPVIGNGSDFVMHEEWKDGAEDWQIEILDRYLNEFGEGEEGDKHIDFYVWW